MKNEKKKDWLNRCIIRRNQIDAATLFILMIISALFTLFFACCGFEHTDLLLLVTIGFFVLYIVHLWKMKKRYGVHLRNCLINRIKNKRCFTEEDEERELLMGLEEHENRTSS